MKTIFSILLSIFLISGLNAQDDIRLSKSEIRKLEREKRKAEQKAELEKKAVLTEWMIDNQRFVLEADFLSDRYSSRIPVSSMINFIMVDSTSAIIQMGSANSIGYNGVGGATLDGIVNKYEVTPVGRKNKSWNISMVFQSSAGTYEITLLVNPSGNADASIRSNWRGQLNYHGDLVPLSMSRVYKGTRTF